MAIAKKFVIRRAETRDARGIAEVQTGSWRETYSGIVPQSFIDSLSVDDKEKNWKEWLQDGAPAGRFTFVAEVEGGRIAGFASGGPLRRQLFAELDGAILDKFDGELMAIYSFKEFQGIGIGKALFGSVSAELRGLGHKSMLIAVLKGNPTRGFYERMGGTEVGKIRVKIGDWLDEIVFGWDQLY